MMGFVFRLFAVVCFAAAVVPSSLGGVIFNTNATWRVFKGTQEASTPTTAWRAINFDDRSWPELRSSFFYGEALDGTVLADMQGNYTSLFLRRSFVLTDASQVTELTLTSFIDDGCVVWINGQEVTRINVPAGELAFGVGTGAAINEGTIPIVRTLTAPTPSSYLRVGTNVIAVQALNASLSSSSDFQFDASLSFPGVDSVPPRIVGQLPAPGVVGSLTALTVWFSEPVQMVNATDLLINGQPAADVVGGNDTYTFRFPEPPPGTVVITWAGSHGIIDVAAPPNSFNSATAGNTWQYTLQDLKPPIPLLTLPTPESLVRELVSIEVQFSEGVSGVDAGDLLINGTPATNVTIFSASEYVFRFPQPPTGRVDVAWRSGHGIVDKAAVPNPFAGGAWSYILDPNAALSDVVINEFLAVNDRGIRDEDGDASDWIEIYNAGATPVSLAGWFLTDDARNLSKWRFPAVTLNPRSFLVVFASEKNRILPSAPLHTNFKLERNGEFLALVRPDRTTLSSDYRPTYPPQRTDVSYGLDRSTRLFPGYFLTPTPGAANSERGEGFAPDVEFSRAGGSFTTSFLLNLSVMDTNASIFYTTNGTLPTTNSLRYISPITINAKARIRAQSFQVGKLPGPVRSEYFFQVAAALRSFNSDLPIIVIDTFGGSIPNEGDGPAFMAVFEPGVNRRTYLTNQATLSTRVVMDRRGSSTLGNEKGNYNVEARDDAEQDKEIDLLNLPRESDFILHAPFFFDPSLFHNPLAFEISMQMGRYAPRYRFVEVYLNTGSDALSSAQYVGVYNLLEKIKRDDSRVDVARLDPTNSTPPSVTGGYIFKVDRRDSGDSGFTAGGQGLAYVEPKEIELRTPQRTPQRNYLSAHLNEFGGVLGGAGFADPVTGYARYIDIPSWIDHHIINVMTFNVDALRLSAFFFKDRNGKVQAGPVWDFDRALGSTDGRDSNPRVFRAQSADRGTDFFGYGTQAWWGRLFEDIDFWQKWVDRWQQARGSSISYSNLYTMISNMNAAVLESSSRDLARWGQGKRGGTQNSEAAFLRSWLSNRVHFIDTNFLALPSFNRPSGTFSNGSTLVMTAPGGATIYYTTNDTDPRLPGGAVNPAARAYSGPIPLDAIARIRARSFRASHRNLTGPDNPPLSTPWSGLRDARYTPFRIPLPGDLAVTEIHYNPDPPSTAELAINPGWDSGSFEFVELFNVSGTTLDLFGCRFTKGIQFQFASNAPSVLPPGARFLLVADSAAFVQRYGIRPEVAGVYQNALANDGDSLRLENFHGIELFDFSYNDSWYPVTDGLGYSLVLRHSALPEAVWDERTSWRASAVSRGSPGSEDPLPVPLPLVVVNEVLTHTDLPQLDAIELHNPGNSPAPIGGWWISDDRGVPWKYRLPTGTEIPAGGYLAIDESAFNRGDAGAAAFRFSALGDEVWLFAADASGAVLPYSHGFDFGAAQNGVSFGRYINSVGQEMFPAQASLTLGAANSRPRVGPVVLNEIHYHPPDILSGTNRLDNTQDEFIELHNISGSSVDLFDAQFPTNSWILRDAVDFVFPPNTRMPANGFILVVGFDPAINPAALTAFRSKFQVPSEVAVLGPFSGKLDNSSDRVDLARPDGPVMPPAINAGYVPYILTDRVRYSQASPWATNADGFGPSLQKKGPYLFGDDPNTWYTTTHTAGRKNDFGPIDSDGDGMTDEFEDLYGLNKLDPSDASLDGDNDGHDNLEEFRAGTDPGNPASVLKVTSASVISDGSTIQITFESAAGRTYSVWQRMKLGSTTWEKVRIIDAPQDGGTVTVVIPTPGQEAYYQVRLE